MYEIQQQQQCQRTDPTRFISLSLSFHILHQHIHSYTIHSTVWRAVASFFGFYLFLVSLVFFCLLIREWFDDFKLSTLLKHTYLLQCIAKFAFDRTTIFTSLDDLFSRCRAFFFCCCCIDSVVFVPVCL